MYQFRFDFLLKRLRYKIHLQAYFGFKSLSQHTVTRYNVSNEYNNILRSELLIRWFTFSKHNEHRRKNDKYKCLDFIIFLRNNKKNKFCVETAVQQHFGHIYNKRASFLV